MEASFLELMAGQRILMLQGPVGPFFARLSHDLHREGACVDKVSFNGGDWWDARSGHFSQCWNFQGGLQEWPAYCEALLARENFDWVLLFGDCRPVHAAVLPLLASLGVQVGVFEEGYLRPDHITFEREGVNARSTLPRDPEVFRRSEGLQVAPSLPLGSTFGAAARCAMAHHLAASLGKPMFRQYQHHRPLGLCDGLRWVRSYWRREHFRRRETWVMPRLNDEGAPPFFLVALQVAHDAQVTQHSSLGSVEGFIAQVLESFARHAPKSSLLLLKHHPLGRAYADYTALIEAHARTLGIAGRCHAIHDQHLPTLLERSQGVVLLNSTVGLSALDHGKPVKVCASAIYDLPGLTFGGSLDAFWRGSETFRPDAQLLRGFKNYLLAHNQYNGSFYKRMCHIDAASGVDWHRRRDGVPPSHMPAMTSGAEPGTIFAGTVPRPEAPS